MNDYQVCPDCDEDECMKLQREVVAEDQKCCICYSDGEICEFCWSMM